MKTAIVCGAGGFIGCHLVKRLKQEGFWVRGVDLKFPEFSETAADDFVIGDLREQSVCWRIMDRRFDEVYQLAADMGGAGYIFTGENDADIMHNSATINLNIVERCYKRNIKNVFYSAMRAREKARLAALRLITAAIKQREVDERIELDDTQVLVVLDKMSKQRREAIEQYEKAERGDLLEKEKFELDLISQYLPRPLSEDEIHALIDAAIASTGATSIKDMGKVMGRLKPELQGRADMGKVSGLVKARLG